MQSNNTTNIVICGVGGQGTILASDILSYTAFFEGFDVKKSEIHGMAQRGGSVISQVRFGKKVYSPSMEHRMADFVLAFEKLEALRYVHYLKKNGVFVVNVQELPPMSVLLGETIYPSNIVERLKVYGNVYMIDAARIAIELGNVRVVNVVLIGGLSKFLHFKEASWMEAIRKNVKEKFVELNITAFNKGRESLT